MRYLVILLCAWASSAHAQSEWTYLESIPNCNAWTRDILDLTGM